MSRLVNIDPQSFRDAFARFQKLIAVKDQGRRFTTFHDGLAAAWERYKPILRDYALSKLAVDEWSEGSVGRGEILQHAIDAIEIDEDPLRRNNLLSWVNRWGHASRDHRSFLEAVGNPKRRTDLEATLFGLYLGNEDEGITFNRLRDLTGAKYPLLAYLFFLKDIDRFMPIQPTRFDRAFAAMGIDFSTLRQCSWDNYATFNAILSDLRPMLEAETGLKNVRLVDAHSFCWIFATLLKQEAEGSISESLRGNSGGRIVGGREASIIAMRLSVEQTVKNSNGQFVQRTVKNKELRMSSTELEKLIASLLDLQENRCALTGIRLQFHGASADKDLLPSLDRINSNGHYENGNLQVVCQFINFWKGDRDNEEFRRLLNLVRGMESEE